MKRHKMVNLCPTSYEIAGKMPNFSNWIRAQLLSLENKNEIERDREYLEKDNMRMKDLLKDIIDGKKVWADGMGWIKNQYEREDE